MCWHFLILFYTLLYILLQLQAPVIVNDFLYNNWLFFYFIFILVCLHFKSMWCPGMGVLFFNLLGSSDVQQLTDLDCLQNKAGTVRTWREEGVKGNMFLFCLDRRKLVIKSPLKVSFYLWGRQTRLLSVRQVEHTHTHKIRYDQ